MSGFFSTQSASSPCHALARAYSRATTAHQAIAELAATLVTDRPAFYVIFCTCDYAREETQRAIAEAFPKGARVVGATSASLMDLEGHYQKRGMLGLAMPCDEFAITCKLLHDIRKDAVWNSRRLGAELLQQHANEGRLCTPDNTFAVLLVDGLNFCEETVVTGVASSLGSISFCGGSAGDDMAWDRGDVFYEGQYYPHAAVLMLIHTQRRFKVFSSHPFQATDQRFVVTRADPSRRLVYEIDGQPAVLAYAQLLNVSEAQMRDRSVDCKTLITRIGASDYVRSVERIEDQALKFACAIDEGAVLRIAEKGNALETLKQHFDNTVSQIGELDLTWGFDCAYNRLELSQDPKMDDIAKLYQRAKLLGISSFGEQINGLHVNQTLTGVAIGKHRRSAI